MRKGTEIWSDYDRAGRWCLDLKKQKGRFTVDEVQEALAEYGEGWYMLLLHCGGEAGDDFAVGQGDFLQAYPAEEVLQ